MTCALVLFGVFVGFSPYASVVLALIYINIQRVFRLVPFRCQSIMMFNLRQALLGLVPLTSFIVGCGKNYEATEPIVPPRKCKIKVHEFISAWDSLSKRQMASSRFQLHPQHRYWLDPILPMMQLHFYSGPQCSWISKRLCIS